MTRRRLAQLAVGAAGATGLGALAGWAGWQRLRPGFSDLAEGAYDRQLPVPDGPRRVFHLGHSLVGDTMPAMLAQLARVGHVHAVQRGSGTSLKEHWEPDLPIRDRDGPDPETGFADARAAIGSGRFDAVVLTEMVEIRDAIRYHDSAVYFARWADLARSASPTTEVFLYETWHRLDTPDGWLDRLDRDLDRYWLDGVLIHEIRDAQDRPPLLIPAGQAMGRFVREVEARGGIGPLEDRTSLFAKNDDGSQDQIHLNDFGCYLVALTHFACLYRRSPVGLPWRLDRSDDTPADPPGAEAAEAMQQAAWAAVTSCPYSGVTA